MSYAFIVTLDETDETGVISTGKAAIIGRFTVKNKETPLGHGSAAKYLAKSFLLALMTTDGNIEELTSTQVEALRAHKANFEKTNNEEFELTDWEYMSA